MNQGYSELGYWVCVSFQHLRAFSMQADNIDEFDSTILAGQVGVLLNALRGRGRVNEQELSRIAKGQKIPVRRIKENLIPTLRLLNSERISITVTGKKSYVVEEHLDSAELLYEIVGQVWEMLDPSLIERGAIYILKHTFVMPRTHSEEAGLLTRDGLSDEDAESTLGVTTSFRLVQSFAGKGLDESVLFNPYIWRANQEKIAHAIVRLPPAERSVVNSSIETVSKWQGYPLASLNAQKELIVNSHAVGLLDLVEVHTGTGDKKEFVFTPHLTTHPDVTRLADDLLNDVRAVLACVSYGEHYSRISRLGGEQRDKTINTLRKLLRENEAGDATAIGVDYQLLEARGIITASPTSTWPGGRYKMQLLRREPIEIALKIIEEAVNSTTAGPLLVHTRNLNPASFFAAPEQTRLSAAPAIGAQPEEVKEARNYFLKTIRKEVF